ncbi:MAG: UDP-N-acetylglucosamine 1-carboxyvinyltransferase [Bifidobacteriaceae bacterium]|nr:UDP-N-acetylglucosamine 1-carboxyvinyltransferase [Bifidobacteriaceae bacterium]
MSDILKVEGGRSLSGIVQVRGAKNFVPKAMVAALLTDQESRISNVPNIRDVEITSQLLEMHGSNVTYDSTSGELTIDPGTTHKIEVSDVATLAGYSRIPILLCGPLIRKLGEAKIPTLGGCSIGSRPLNFHFDSLRKFGASVKFKDFGAEIKAPHGLKGTKIQLPYPSVGATEQILLTGVSAEGVTEISNAAIEPEIIDLIAVLQKMGAIISVETDRVITIEGTPSLKGFQHRALNDRIESGSWAALALATDGEIYCQGAEQNNMSTFLNVFHKIGGEFDIDENGIRFYRKHGSLKGIALETDVHPGFMTDWQQPLVVALTQAEGASIIHETVYEDRFGFVAPLKDLGAKIQLYKECLGSIQCRFKTRNFEHSCAIFGPTPLHGSNIEIPDLRGGFSHIIAALTAQGESRVSGVSLINRGYENFEQKLQAIGADFIFED